MKSSIGDEARLRHILDSIAEIESYISADSFDSFSDHSMKKFATAKQIEIIGEAANHISDKLKETYPDISWKEIVAFVTF